jgi:uncharacterized membrane protein
MPSSTVVDAGAGGREARSEDPGTERNVAAVERAFSVVAGGMFLLNGLSRRDLAGGAESLVGAYLTARGLSGHCPVYHALGVSTANGGDAGSLPVRKMVHVQKGFTVNKPAEELYAFWRRLENLPSFMEHLESVTDLGDGRSRWVSKAPLHTHVEWEAEITDEEPGRFIAWRSVEGSSIANSGRVRFDPAPAGRGTEVRVSLEYAPPAGAIGDTIAKLFGEAPEQQIEDDLRHFKQLAEAGEIPTTKGQPSGRVSRSALHHSHADELERSIH